ncbi:hypothetical protein [Desulfonema limicola]|uniref:hypothetical protein n=1 Tax=Desulfonema limicola TaxID=45656 RepID=UPI001A9B290D|nr:hypothetical protein [Desulfonema limicola]
MKQACKRIKDIKWEGIIQSLFRKKTVFLFGSLLMICCYFPIGCAPMSQHEFDKDDEIIMKQSPKKQPMPQHKNDTIRND